MYIYIYIYMCMYTLSAGDLSSIRLRVAVPLLQRLLEHRLLHCFLFVFIVLCYGFILCLCLAIDWFSHCFVCLCIVVMCVKQTHRFYRHYSSVNGYRLRISLPTAGQEQ